MKLTDEQKYQIGDVMGSVIEDIINNLYGNAKDVPTGKINDDGGEALLEVLTSWDGLHESANCDELMGYFKEVGIDFNPSLLPWCGVGLRVALIKGGYEDPGPQAAKAETYKDYGDPIKDEDIRRGDVWVSATHTAAIDGIREDGVIMLRGCNQSNKCCVQPAQNRNGHKNYGDRIAVRRARKAV